MKYFLKKSNEKKYREVTKEKYIEAERNAGFQSKFGENEIATAQFSTGNISGKVEYSNEEIKRPEHMHLGELVSEMINKTLEFVVLESKLDPFVIESHWRNAPYPEGKDNAVRSMKESYEDCKLRIENLHKEFERREQEYKNKKLPIFGLAI